MSIDKSIQDMLDYQEFDMRYIRLENEVKASEESKKRNKYALETQTILNDLTKMEGVAKSTMDIVEKSKAKFDDITKQIDEICAEIEQESDDKQLDYYAKQLERLMQTLDDMDKEIAKDNKDLSDSGYKYPKMMDRAKEARINYNKANQEYAKLVQ